MVNYKGHLLKSGSFAYELWANQKYKELDKHLARLHREALQRGEFVQ